MKDADLARSIGKAARKARMALGLTQEQTAERLDITTEFYARLERGTAKPSIGTFVRMVMILGVSADTLLGLDDTQPCQHILAQGEGASPYLH